MTTPVSNTSVTAARPQPVVVAIDNPTQLAPCDRCVGTALWQIVLPSGGELILCGHHARKHGFVGEGSHAAYEEDNRQKGSDH